MDNSTETPTRKGLGTLAWIGIGCGVFLLVAFVAISGLVWWGYGKAKEAGFDPELMADNPTVAAARMILKATPDYEEVEFDDQRGVFRVRHKETGEIFEVNLEDAQQGRFELRSGDQSVTIDTNPDEGEATISVSGDEGDWKLTTGQVESGDLPDWVPVCPGCEPSARHVMEGAEGVRGTFQLDTNDGVAELVHFYASQLEGAGFSVTVNTFSGEGEEGGVVNASHEADGRSVVVMIGTEEGRTSATVSYSEER
jgi:hypothetical protein